MLFQGHTASPSQGTSILGYGTLNAADSFLQLAFVGGFGGNGTTARQQNGKDLSVALAAILNSIIPIESTV